MVDEHYLDPKLAMLYDLDSGWSIERDFYVQFCAPTALDVLDIGCGTGLIACKLASLGHRVFGVDPASAMLAVGRQSKFGAQVTWIESTAQTLSLDCHVDRIIMTGNAFQVLLSDEDVAATFCAMRNHLDVGGKIAFETRNPLLNWRERWNYDMQLETPSGQVHEQRRWLSMVKDVMTFKFNYVFEDRTLTTRSVLRFWHLREIESHLKRANLRIVNVYGDWRGEALDLDVHEEMVFVIEAC